jgi:hypothetical protein
MKTQLLRTSLAVLMAAAASYGQNSKINVNVPFSFVVGTKTLPPGQYTVDDHSDFVTIISADWKGSLVRSNTSSVEPSTAHQPECLVFRRYGTHYFLSEVWLNDRNRGLRLGNGTLERELSKRPARPETEIIAATR